MLPRDFGSHEAIRNWCNILSSYFADVIKKREVKPIDKWHKDKLSTHEKSALKNGEVADIAPAVSLQPQSYRV